jgi:hypothetical protein
MKKRIIMLLTVVALMVVMLAMSVAPAFAQTGFNDVSAVTFGGNCAVNDVVEICDVLPE